MTVARRYAKALLTLGKEDAHYKEYGEGLSGFAHLLEREPELKDALLNPIHGREDRNKLLLRMIELLQLPPMVSNLLQLLLGAATCGLTYLLGRRVFGTASIEVVVFAR